MSPIKSVFVLLYRSVTHLMVMFLFLHKMFKNSGIRMCACHLCARAMLTYVCTYTLGMKLPDLAHATACCVEQG